jgi:hypothetical protein
MKDGYEMTRNREAARSNERQRIFEAQHTSNNAFVREHEAMTATMGAKAPDLQSRYMNFDSNMVSDGLHAQEFARGLTHGLDKKAFPVK